MSHPVVATAPLGFPWATLDPFLFCAYHDDSYPEGTTNQAPAVSLEGRNLGSDFSRKDGFSMYHGRSVPGFPQHPHRGFETVTLVREGTIDHADSMGATARFGGGDCQWMTAGKGVVHSEMFPLRETDKPNPLNLFQIWLNLPAKSKMVEPYFTMLWDEEIPRVDFVDEAGRSTRVLAVAGQLGDGTMPSPPPDSWASQEGSDVAIWTVSIEEEGEWELPAAPEGVSRVLYFHEGSYLEVAGQSVESGHAIQLDPTAAVKLKARGARAELLLLQGRPIGEPVAQHGPFVMNTREEVAKAYSDYQRTRFGGWPWPSSGPVHDPTETRFARHRDGKEERPTDPAA